LSQAGAGTAALAAFNPKGLPRLLEATAAVADRAPADVAQDETYWAEIQQAPRGDSSMPDGSIKWKSRRTAATCSRRP
jgi:hypothetical protein